MFRKPSLFPLGDSDIGQNSYNSSLPLSWPRAPSQREEPVHFSQKTPGKPDLGCGCQTPANVKDMKAETTGQEKMSKLNTHVRGWVTRQVHTHVHHGGMLNCSGISDSLRPHELKPARLLGPLGWVAMSFSRGSSQPRDQTHVSWVSCIGRLIPYHCATQEALYHGYFASNGKPYP